MRLAVAETTPYVPPLSLLARVPTSPLASISLPTLLDTVVALLPRWASEPTATDVVLALLQLLCSLTEDEDLARRFLAADGVATLLSLPAMGWPAGGSGGVGGPAGGQPPRAVVRSILRHVAEDKATLEEAMSADVRSLIGANRRSSSGYAFTVATMLAQAAPMVARHVGSFTAAVALSCRLRPAFSETASPTVEAVPDLPLTPAQLADQRLARPNVTRVVEELVRVLAPLPPTGTGGGKGGAAAGVPSRPPDAAPRARPPTAARPPSTTRPVPGRWVLLLGRRRWRRQLGSTVPRPAGCHRRPRRPTRRHRRGVWLAVGAWRLLRSAC